MVDRGLLKVALVVGRQLSVGLCFRQEFPTFYRNRLRFEATFYLISRLEIVLGTSTLHEADIILYSE